MHGMCSTEGRIRHTHKKNKCNRIDSGPLSCVALVTHARHQETSACAHTSTSVECFGCVYTFFLRVLTDCLCGLYTLSDYTDPLEMIKHLFVGSEGTFGFVSRATYHSVPDYKDKASAFIMFPTVEDASNATWELRKAGCTDAVELFDRRSLRKLS